MAGRYYVAKNGSDQNEGSVERPFLSIQKAADTARPGDRVIVREGVYREAVSPRFGGLSPYRRITYEAAPGEKVVIKGSERIRDWEPYEGSIWKVTLPESFFGGFNPYREVLRGDWLVYKADIRHRGDVYLNGMSFYEAEDLEALKNPPIRESMFDHRTGRTCGVKNPEQTRYLWYADCTADSTTIYANFHGRDPNKELTEINVRPYCFYPEKTRRDYITVRGFTMEQAATPWVPPTADQPGLIGPHWSKGWIIEDNTFRHAKCSAVSLGKEYSTGDNFKTERLDKPGYQYQLESVFTAERQGWSKERIGSHIVRRNTIYDCGQNGIVGHLGCVFSEIYDNHIYNIGIKREFFGYEIAGIKLHAAIDVSISDNFIHDATLGLWLDWQAQGARISRNLFAENARDFYVEVTSGPHLVDHNIFASEDAIENHAQGGAYVHNLILGRMHSRKIMDRSTPYHLPHSTKVKGYAKFYSGDERFFRNIFAAPKSGESCGTAAYDGYPSSWEAYMEKVRGIYPGDHVEYESIEQPVYIEDNLYLNGAEAFEEEENARLYPAFDPEAELCLEEDGIYLCIRLPEGLRERMYAPLTTPDFGRLRIVDAEFENPDGSPLYLNKDFTGRVCKKAPAGPIALLRGGRNKIKIRAAD